MAKWHAICAFCGSPTCTCFDTDEEYKVQTMGTYDSMRHEKPRARRKCRCCCKRWSNPAHDGRWVENDPAHPGRNRTLYLCDECFSRLETEAAQDNEQEDL